jgi:DNA invertase Pin-like site-specific DNA recombinase
MKRHIAYYRVSTDRQGRSGLGLDAQRSAVAAYIAGRGELTAEYTEIESGKRNDRPQLAEALTACRQQKAVLVIARLDRLARNVAFIANLMDSTAEFVAVDMPQANRLTLHILAAVAEHERELISKRTREALAAAKARGQRLGNPRAALAAPLAHQAARQQADDFALPLRPLLDSMRDQGQTLQAIADEMNRRGIATARGGLWRPQTVQNLLRRKSA